MEVLVLGCGVSGLTSAVRLREAGFAVSILTRELPPETTSAVAAAIWYPYRVAPARRVGPWAERTLEVFGELARDPATGVSWITMLELFDHSVADPPWRDAVPGFRRAEADELPAGYTAAWVAEVPRIETPVFLSWLMERFLSLGGAVKQVPDGVASLGQVTRPRRLVLHATGVDARQVAADARVFPIRGQIVRVRNPGLDRALADDQGPLALAYVVPRRHDVILGGTAQVGIWDTTPEPATAEEILRKAVKLEPRLAGAEILGTRVGLRPGRDEVRLELEETPGGPVIHNYGHGGAGFTVCWGCAEEAVELAREWGARC